MFQISSRRHPLRARAFLIIVSLLALPALAAGQAQTEARLLGPGQPLERTLQGGETHRFEFRLTAGQVAQVEVEQRGIDVAVSLFGTDGHPSVTLDSKGGRLWRERVSCLAEKEGNCRVEVSASQKGTPAGRYTIKLTAPRPSTAQDRERLLAERALGEGRQLYEGNQRAEALAKYEEAVAFWQKTGDKYWEAVALFSLGLVSNNLSKNTEAMAAFERALSILREQKDRLGEAKTINGIGGVFLSLREYEKARGSYEQALAIRRELKDRLGEGITLDNLGFLYENLSQHEKARDYYEQALAIKREVKDLSSEGLTLNNLGNVYFRLGQYEKAQGYYEQALSLRRQAKDRSGESQALNNLGNVYNYLGQYEKARDYYEQVLAIRREIKDRRGEGSTLTGLAFVYNSLGRTEKAREYLEQALVIRRETKDRRGEGLTLNNLSGFYNDSGQYEKAREYLEQALAIHRETKDRRNEGLTLSNLGIVYDSLGQHEKALDYFGQALAISREIKERRTEGLALNGLGVVHENTGQYEKARNYFEQALVIRREIKDRSGEGDTLTNLGFAYNYLGQHAKAREYLEQALAIKQEVKDRYGEGETINGLGVVYDRLGQHDKAHDYYEQALAIRREVKNHRGEAETLYHLMAFQEGLGRRPLAIFYGKQAVNIYQKIRADIKGLEQESRRSFLKVAENTYRELTALLLKQNRLAEAQQVLNSFKDQQFFDFNQNLQKQPTSLTLTPREAVFVTRYEHMSQRAVTLRQQLDDLKRSSGNLQPDSAEARQLQKLETDLKTASAEFLAVFKQAEAEFSQTPTETDRVGEVPDQTRMQAALRELSLKTKQKAVAIYTLIGKDSFSVLLVTPDAIKKATAAVKAEDFNKKVLHFYEALQSPGYDPRPIGKELYDIVFKLIEPEVKKAGAQTLLWSLDGTLAYVPMAALSPDGKSYLVEHYQNVVFTRADNERMTRAVSPAWTGTGFGSSVAHTINLLSDTLKLNALPGVTKELDAVFRDGDTDGIFNGEVFADARFKKETFFAALKQHRPLVHVSSHFIFRPGDDTRSFLLLGDGTALTLNEMKQQERLFEGVELLTLSACDTAAQQADANGREIDGFAELAQRLGAGAVLASLWSVEDESTVDLMTRFYRAYKSAQQTSKATALRRAQLALLNGKYKPEAGSRRRRVEVSGSRGKSLKPFAENAKAPYAHPYFWSPFVLIGNWR